MIVYCLFFFLLTVALCYQWPFKFSRLHLIWAAPLVSIVIIAGLAVLA